jgi:hypothetical protein
MKKYIALVIATTISICNAADKDPIVDSASFHLGQTTLSSKDTESSTKQIQSAFLNNGFKISNPPTGKQFTLPTQKDSGQRIVTWYSYNSELKAAVIEDPNYSGFSVYVSPDRPTSLKSIWSPYHDLLQKVKDQAQ